MSPPIGNVYGGNIDPRAGSVPLQQQEGSARTTGTGGRPQNGAMVEGSVIGYEKGLYQVRVGGQTLSAASNLPLFVGQRFRAVWDTSGEIPMLRLQPSELALLSRFSMREQPMAFALLSRGLPVTDNVMLPLQQAMARMGSGSERHLPAMVELFVRNIPLTNSNIILLSWYMNLTGQEAGGIWEKLRERLRDRREASIKDWKDTISSSMKENDDVGRFLQAHSMLSRSSRANVDPSALLAHMWWPVGEDGDAYAKVATSLEEQDGRRTWRVSFDTDGPALGQVTGSLMTNGTHLTVDIGTKTKDAAQYIKRHLPLLEEELSDVPLAVQHIGVSVAKERAMLQNRIVDMEA